MLSKHVRLLAAMAMLTFLSMLPTRAAEASIITLNLTATVDTAGETVFGLSGRSIPLTMSFTYDTALNTSSVFVPAGGSLGGTPAGHDFYGYSGSGIVDTNLTFGTQTWTAADLTPTTIVTGVTAGFFADTDLAVAAPTNIVIAFATSTSLVKLGSGGIGSEVFLTPALTIYDFSNGFGSGMGNITVTTSVATPTVPEPTTMVLLGTGLLGAIVSRRRRAR